MVQIAAATGVDVVDEYKVDHLSWILIFLLFVWYYGTDCGSDGVLVVDEY